MVANHDKNPIKSQTILLNFFKFAIFKLYAYP